MRPPAPDAVPLPGGRGRSWRVGDLVYKPLDFAAEVVAWQAEVLAAVDTSEIRVAPPRLVDGWVVTPFLEGRHEPGRWPAVIEAGRRFHAALPDVRPPLVDDPWARADRVAWQEAPYPPIDDLLAQLDPVDEEPALLHGDLTGNVLFHETLPPAIIDFAPYYRPPTYADAIVVADALCWEGAPRSLADLVPRQFLLRALIYRGVTQLGFGRDGDVELGLARRIAAP